MRLSERLRRLFAPLDWPATVLLLANRVLEVIGVALYVLLRGIPFIGWLIGLVATLIGLGALWLIWREAPATPPITKETPVMA